MHLLLGHVFGEYAFSSTVGRFTVCAPCDAIVMVRRSVGILTTTPLIRALLLFFIFYLVCDITVSIPRII